MGIIQLYDCLGESALRTIQCSIWLGSQSAYRRLLLTVLNVLEPEIYLSSSLLYFVVEHTLFIPLGLNP